jgi:putative ABC transport system permease protein
MAGIRTMPAAEIARRVGLEGADAERIRAGGAVILGHPDAIVDGSLTFVVGTTNPASSAPADGGIQVDNEATVTDTFTVPAVSVPAGPASPGIFFQDAAVLVPQEVVEAHHLPNAMPIVLVHDTTGPISESTREGVNALVGEDYGFQVERGFQRDDQLAIAILVTAFALIMLVVTLTSTALSLAEQQREDATMAAVGATRTTRRLISAGQAMVTSGVGSILGLIVGAVCGYAFTYPLTAMSWDANTGAEKFVAPTLGIPWAWLAVAVIGVPLLATALAAVGVRRAPVVTRRLA